ncbi:hypothetical protein LEN26_008843 [Aphanomyces euteiches]|nr:hypothetical protein AeMF1_021281 [Aphanomyces euteiches]KAH9130109.1 hypothetical protein LEN26_008843 [Aphanomyces euteiches]KAH9190287.1 hypothetical protein AeNC1_007738 [Aphanomyces euteiches]
MTDCSDAMTDIPLHQLCLPGSHNSGSYGVHGKNVSGDCDAALVRYIKHVPGVAGFVARWAKCQRLSIMEQLDAGIRYFDMRIQVCHDDTIRLCHSLWSITLNDFLDQVHAFLDANPLELVVLDVNHIYLPHPRHHSRIAEACIQHLGRARVARAFDASPHMSLRAFRAKNVQVILIYHNADTAHLFDVWGPHSITAPWPNVASKTRIFSYAYEVLHARVLTPPQLHVLQLVPTARGKDLLRHLSVLKFSRPIVLEAPQWLLSLFDQTPALLPSCNIVLVDDCAWNDNALVTALLQLNERKAEMRIKSINIT